MAKRVTNTDLANKIDDVNARVEKVETKMQEFHDYMIVQKDRDNPLRTSKGKVDWYELAKQFLIFLTVAAGIILVIVQVFAERIK